MANPDCRAKSGTKLKNLPEHDHAYGLGRTAGKVSDYGGGTWMTGMSKDESAKRSFPHCKLALYGTAVQQALFRKGPGISGSDITDLIDEAAYRCWIDKV